MEFESINGKFTIAIPDEMLEDNKNEKIEVNLSCLEEEVSLFDLADTISKDLFYSDKLDLKHKTIACWLTNAKGEGRLSPFVVEFRQTIADVLVSIAEQWFI